MEVLAIGSSASGLPLLSPARAIVGGQVMPLPARSVAFGFLLTFVTCALASAEPITVTFTAFPAAGDPVNVGPSTGFFTFDSSLIPPGGGRPQDPSQGLPVIDISLRWGRTHWTTANAGLGELLFSPSGSLLGWVIGGQPGLYGLIVSPASAVVDDIFVTSFKGLVSGDTGSILYTNAGFEGSLQSVVRDEFVQAPIPEPSSMILLLSGTAAACGVRVRTRRRSAGAKDG